MNGFLTSGQCPPDKLIMMGIENTSYLIKTTYQQLSLREQTPEFQLQHHQKQH